MIPRFMTSVIAALLPLTAQAAWFATLDSGGKVMAIGIATDPEEVSSLVKVTCDGPILSIEFESRHNAEAGDLPGYKGAKIALSYKVDGEVKKMGVDGEPVATVGGILAFRSTLTAQQSKAIYLSIAKGYRLDFELLHPELLHDQGVKKIWSEGFTAPLMALNDNCKGLYD